MSLSINYNSAAQTAEYYLNNATNAENSAIQKLSSGYKINSAADDPAGYVISQNSAVPDEWSFAGHRQLERSYQHGPDR